MGRRVHNKSTEQKHFEFLGTLPKPSGDASLSVFGFPRSGGIGASEKHPNIHVTNNAPDYWQARGRRPQTVERRQIEKIKTTIEFARRDDIAWLGHFDNDEFLHVPSHANVGMRLARLDDDVMCAPYPLNIWCLTILITQALLV